MSFLREMAAELFVMAVVGLMLGLLGPFGTFALPLDVRVPAWLLLAIAGYGCFRPVLAAGTAMHERTGVPRLATIAGSCLIAAVPTTFVATFVLDRLRLGTDGGKAIADLYPQVLLVGGIATTVQLALFGRSEKQPGGTATNVAAPPLPIVTPAVGSRPSPLPGVPTIGPAPVSAAPSFLDRLPPAQRHTLLCLEMEDHYVRAHGATGSALVLLRMRDAVAELAGVEGMRVHRSWWVARAAVAEVIRRDRALLLRLVNGIEVPVARAEVPALRAAGWLS